ncbi:hypothetical protein NE865_13370 [Phthorimaea operculella]|nr:hypothetical protein NE865_13370 [Phthorimaea operculella]
MYSTRYKGLMRGLIILFLIKPNLCQNDEEIKCSRTPLHSKTNPLPPDNRFVIDMLGADSKYIPGQPYTVQLHSPVNATFIAFTIWTTGSQAYNDKNPLKPHILSDGLLISYPDPSLYDTVSKVCKNTLYEANVLPKTKVVAQWIAPPKNNDCVTINAYVAVKPDVWYNNEGPLSKRICEDYRKSEDMKPPENINCQVCEEARYELTFQGTWSNNTHLNMYPNTPIVKFSDIVGASHTKTFHLYEENAAASEGMKMLAEQGNTTSLEHEILKGLGQSVRTVIKATGPPKPSLSTKTSFRTSRDHHFISLATSITPSPDWFLGVYNLELCNASSGKWSDHVVYNLYPMDAGTDSGLTFESSPEPTIPPQVIKKTDFGVPQDKMIPFAKLRVRLVRTYPNPKCIAEGTTETVKAEDEDDTDGTGEADPEPEPEPLPRPTSRPRRPRPRPTPPTYNKPTERGYPEVDMDDECPMTDWEEDADGCQGICEDERVSGFKTFYRYYMVNGKRERVHPKEICNTLPITKTEECEDVCSVTTTTGPEAQQGNWEEWVKPGQKWKTTG